MATITKSILTKASVDAVWSAIRDIGALHTRLVPGFVTHTRVEPGTPVVRVVTFGDGSVVREPIVSIDEAAHRLVWTIEGAAVTHYNAAVEVSAEPGGTRVVWRSDLLPETAAAAIDAAMTAGMAAMTTSLAKLAVVSEAVRDRTA